MASLREVESGPVGRAAVQIERILCPLDFSEVSAKAYRYAQSITCHYRAKLIVQHVVELWRHPEGDFAAKPEYFDQFRDALISNARGKLQQLVDLSGGIQPEFILEEGTAADGILAVARGHAVNLIVMGTHGRRGFDHLMLGSVTERVLRHAPCPVLAISGPDADQCGVGPVGDPVEVRSILCCVDFSTPSRRALEHALSVAAAYDADLTLLHVLDTPKSDDLGQELNASLDKLRHCVAPSAIPQARLHLEVRLGKAYREILNFAAEKRSDLIVTGVRGRNSLDLAVFGSTTYRVIQLYSGPVLTVSI